jgi:hypothetical protein
LMLNQVIVLSSNVSKIVRAPSCNQGHSFLA